MAAVETPTKPADQPLADKTTSRPSLHSGDRMNRYEFHRRYSARPDIPKAELVEGVVYVSSPLRLRSHGKPHSNLDGWLVVYSAATPGVELGNNATVQLDLDNEPQPDLLLRIETAAGGRSRVTDDDYVEGPPELVAEIAASSLSYDLHDKLRAYRRNGVQEYIVWRVEDRKVDWFELNEGEYAHLAPDEAGVVHSRVFPGLRLATQALLDGDIAAVLADLQTGLASPEHAAFVERMRARLAAQPRE